MSDSDDERYEQGLVKQRQEAEAKLWEEEEQQQVERRARKEARAAEKRRQEEELRRRAEEKEAQRKVEEEKAWRREEERQRDLAHCIEVDRVATMEQQRQKLDQDFFAFESSFQRGHELDRPSVSDQEATYPIFASRNSGGSSMT